MFDFRRGGLAFSITKINTGRKSSALATDECSLVLCEDLRNASNMLRLQSTIHLSFSLGDFRVSISMISAIRTQVKPIYTLCEQTLSSLSVDHGYWMPRLPRWQTEWIFARLDMSQVEEIQKISRIMGTCHEILILTKTVETQLSHTGVWNDGTFSPRFWHGCRHHSDNASEASAEMTWARIQLHTEDSFKEAIRTCT